LSFAVWKLRNQETDFNLSAKSRPLDGEPPRVKKIFFAITAMCAALGQGIDRLQKESWLKLRKNRHAFEPGVKACLLFPPIRATAQTVHPGA
jgi:hypothetical protein